MNKLMFVLGVTLFFASCETLLQKDVRKFIEGSYVRSFDNEFAVGMDSVVLQKQGGDNYLIVKYSRFSRIKNGQLLPEEMKQEKMMGVYDENKKVINEVKKGKVLSFDPEEQTMMIGASEYRKVK